MVQCDIHTVALQSLCVCVHFSIQYEYSSFQPQQYCNSLPIVCIFHLLVFFYSLHIYFNCNCIMSQRERVSYTVHLCAVVTECIFICMCMCERMLEIYLNQLTGWLAGWLTIQLRVYVDLISFISLLVGSVLNAVLSIFIFIFVIGLYVWRNV